MNVLISRENWNKIIAYSESAHRQFKSEIGGMAICYENKDGDWVIHDPVILKQTITASNTHLKKKELAIYYTDAHKKYKKYNYRFLWWHSHHTMQAFWSGTDLDTIDEFKEGDFSFALVVNLKEEYKCRISVWEPIEVHEDVELEIVDSDKKDNAIDKEVKELCEKENVYTYGNGNMTIWGKNNQAQSHRSHLSQQLGTSALWELDVDESSDNQEVLEYLIEKADELLQKMSYGEEGFKGMCKEFKKINTKMKKIKASFKLDIPRKEEADEIYTSDPQDFIIPSNPEDNAAIMDLNTYLNGLAGFHGYY